MDNLTTKLYKSPNTVFTSRDLALLWNETNKNNLKAKVAYYVKRGTLTRLARGLFVKDTNYNPRELAANVYSPSYISFETILRESGIIFQHYDTLFVAGPWSKTIIIDKTKITFRKLKAAVLFSPAGVENNGTYNVASPERAFLDMLYLFPEYYFDNLRDINWEKCFAIASTYNNRELIKRLKKYRKKYA